MTMPPRPPSFFPRSTRWWWAWLVAPLAGTALFLWPGQTQFFMGFPPTVSELFVFLMLPVAGLPFALCFLPVAILPVLVLRRRHALRWWVVVAAGALAPTLFLLALVVLNGQSVVEIVSREGWAPVWKFSPSGAVTAAVWWWLSGESQRDARTGSAPRP